MPVEEKADFKTQLRRLVAGNYLQEATEKLLKATKGDEYGDFRSRVVHVSGQLNQYIDLDIDNTEDYDTVARQRNKVSLSLLELIDTLPDEAALKAGKVKPPGVSEAKLKKRLFWFLIIGKILVLFYAFFLLDTGSGFTSDDMLTTVGVLIPMFGVFLAIMLQDTTKHRRILKPGDIRLTSDFARKAYFVVVVYPLLLVFLLFLRAVGKIPTPAAFTIILGLAESGWGAYVGKVVFGLFKEE